MAIVCVVVLGLAAGAAYALEPPLPLTRAPSRDTLYLSFVGDVMHHDQNAVMPDFDRLYDPVRTLLSNDDLSFANIEFPVDPARPPAGYPLFNGSVAYLRAALGAGFRVLALSNNHTFDYGVGSVTASMAVYDDLSSGIPLFHNGIREYTSAPFTPTTIIQEGWRIGFVSITSFSNVPGSEPFVNVVNYWNDAARLDFLDAVRSWSAEYDLVIVAVHDGAEYVTEPDEAKAAFFRQISEAGAQIVWGHHPHVLQPWERRGRGVIIHSAGNFVSAQRGRQSPWVPLGRWAPTGDTAVYRVRVDRSTEGVAVTDVRTPFFSMHDDPAHGLVLKSFDTLFREPMSLEWRAFYLARYAVLHRSLRGSAGR